MSAPPSQAKPPGDDFVLWPEADAQGAGRVNEAVIRRSLAGLAPAEWVADPEAEEPGVAGEREKPPREDRFYPASRSWFRTTATIPASDAADKWWKEAGPTQSPPSPRPAPQPASAVDETKEEVGLPTPDLLSPEEIWELAAEELAQVSRLGAPAAGTSIAPPGRPTEPAALPVALAKAVLEPLSRPPAPTAVPDPSAVVAPMGVPVALPSLESADDLSPPAVPSALATAPVVRAPAPLVADATAADFELNPPSPVASEVAAAVELLYGGAEPEKVAPAPPPLIAFPSTAAKGVVAPVGPFEPTIAPEWPEPAVEPAVNDTSELSLLAVEKPTSTSRARALRDTLPEVSMPEPVAAIPVVSRSPLSLRSEKVAVTLPTQRRTVLPDRAKPVVFEDVGLAVDGSPATGAGTAVVNEEREQTGEVHSVGERRRRRQRSERRRSAEPSLSGVRWGRWLAGVFGLAIVAAAVAAIVARDHLPSEWRRSATRWYHKAHQMVFPHQYGYPRRGVQPRTGPSPEAGTPSGEPTPVLQQKSADREGASPTPEASVASTDHPMASIPTLVESPESSAPATASEYSAVEPVATGDVVPDETIPPLQVPSTQGEPPATAPAEAEPVEEAPPVVGAVTPTVPEAESSVDPGQPGAGSAAAAESTAKVVASDGFTLWSGDDGPDAEDPSGGTSRPPLPAATEPASAEVAEGQKAVRSLVSARSVADVLPWIFDAPTLEATVRTYYESQPLLPLTEAVIEHEYSGVIPATGGKAHIFNVLDAAHPRGFPVSAESTPEGYRIDWQSYIQWRDGWLRRFLIAKPAEPQTLFVVLRRTHYFNDDVPKLDGKLAFKITSAVPGDEGAVAFVEKNTAIGRSLADMYEWRTMYFPVVELQWVTDGKDGRYLRLNRIVRTTWRRIGE